MDDGLDALRRSGVPWEKDPTVIMYPYVHIGKKVSIGNHVVIGAPFRRYSNAKRPKRLETWIGNSVQIGNFAEIMRGTRIGDACDIESYASLQELVVIGSNSKVLAKSEIGGGVKIGRHSIVGRNVVGEGSLIGDYCTVLGNLMHSRRNPKQDWDHPGARPAPVVKDSSIVGFGAILIGDVTVGPNAYVLDGARVTKDVLPGYIATGRNELVFYKDWNGKLRESPMWKGL